MDVQLYVYDLSQVRRGLSGGPTASTYMCHSQGLARQLSAQFLGTQIDAVYHTSIVLQGIEYFFGQGVQTCRAGATHHGRPMEVIKLGQTSLPIEIVLEYLESLKEVYTAEVRSWNIGGDEI